MSVRAEQACDGQPASRHKGEAGRIGGCRVARPSTHHRGTEKHFL